MNNINPGDFVIVNFDIYDDKFTIKKVRKYRPETKMVYFYDWTSCKLEDCQPYLGKLPERDNK